jgi:hypothetical protein
MRMDFAAVVIVVMVINLVHAGGFKPRDDRGGSSFNAMKAVAIVNESRGDSRGDNRSGR